VYSKAANDCSISSKIATFYANVNWASLWAAAQQNLTKIVGARKCVERAAWNKPLRGATADRLETAT